MCCFGIDNPYLLIERHRTLEESSKSASIMKESVEEETKPPAYSKNTEDWVRVLKTNYTFDNKNPLWDPIACSMSEICNSNKVLPLRLSVYSYDNSGEHFLYGRVVTTIREIEMGCTTLQIRNPKGKVSGKINFLSLRMDMRGSLLKYL